MEKQKNDVTNKELDDFFIIFAHATLFHLEQWIKAEELSGMSYLRCNFEGLGYHFQFDSLAGFGELLKSHLPDLLSMEKTQLCVEKHLETGFWPISKHETGEEKDRQVILALIVPIAESCQQLNSWPLTSLTDEQILEQYHRCRATWGDANSHFTITFPLINFSSDMGQPRQLSHHLSLAPLIPAEKTTLWNDDAKLFSHTPPPMDATIFTQLTWKLAGTFSAPKKEDLQISVPRGRKRSMNWMTL